jgi:hypothetical protein
MVDPAGLDDPAVLRTMDGVEYRAWTDVMESYPVQLQTNVRITNRGRAAVDLTFQDGCVVLIRAKLMGGGVSAKVWDQGRTLACTLALVRVHLEPGSWVQHLTRSGAREILGDSLPDGRYVLEAYLRPLNGMLTVHAGVVDLSVPRN